MDFTEILYEQDDALRCVRVTLNRPEKRNRLSARMLEELCEALERARRDDAVRVVVLGGAGGTFSAGGDLSKMAGGGENPLHAAVRDLLLSLRRMDKPVVAMIEGPCMAGALGIVCACHLAIASESAIFATPEIHVGLWPMMISSTILRAIGPRRALELFLTGDRIGAGRALEIGLVHRVAPEGKLEEETLALVRALAEKSPAVIRLGLQAFAACEDLEYERQVAELGGWLAKVVATEDAKEGTRAFLEKRRPVFTGR